MPKKLKQVVAESSPPTDHVVHLRKRVRDVEAENRRLREAVGSQKEMAEQIAAAVVACPPIDQRPRGRGTRVKHQSCPVVPVFEFSDWHIGEVVQADETEGFNHFDYDESVRRINQIVDDELKWVDVNRGAYRIDRCAIIAKGDFISGDIHDELKATNEFPVPVQTARAGLLLGEMVRRIAGRFKHVDFFQVGADNHGRLTRKPQAKQKATNNMTYLVYVIANESLRKCGNVRAHGGPGMKVLCDVNGHKFLCEHGDTMRAWSGLPFYAFSRAVGREATRRMNTDKGFEYFSIGHFHTPCYIEGRTIVNGSLSGTSEFDHSCGRHAPPCQVAYLVSERHGIFGFTAFQGV